MKIMKKKQCYSGIILILALFSISSYSLWGDEICRVYDPISGDLFRTIQTSLGYGQPGYMLFLYIWTRFAGAGEWNLRLSNLLFLLPAIYFAFRIIEAKKWPLETVFAFFLHPMLVNYMNEATPYILVYALSLAFTYLVFYKEGFHEWKTIVKIHCVYFLGVFVHFIFGFIIVLYVTRVIAEYLAKRGSFKRHVVVLLCFTAGYLPLLYLYLTRLLSTVSGFGIKNLLFIVYGFLGMVGMGLSRNDLRAGNFSGITLWQMVFLGAFVLLMCWFLSLAVRHRMKFLKKNRLLLWAAGFYFLCFIVVSVCVNFSLWERHCITVFPVYLIVFCDFFMEAKEVKTGKAAIGFYFLMLILSSLNIRFNYYYFNDDYQGVQREVAKEFQEEERLTVLTDVLTEGYNGYYNFSDDIRNEEQNIVDIREKTEAEVEALFEDAASRGKATLILFEKSWPWEFYHHYDNEDGYTVNDSYNSFKIVTAD